MILLVFLLAAGATSEVLFDLANHPMDFLHNVTAPANITSALGYVEVSPDSPAATGNLTARNLSFRIDVGECNVRLVLAVPATTARNVSLSSTVVLERGDGVSFVFGGVLAVILRPQTGGVQVRVVLVAEGTFTFQPWTSLVELHDTSVLTAAAPPRFRVVVVGRAPLLAVRVTLVGSEPDVVNQTFDVTAGVPDPRAFQIFSSWYSKYAIETLRVEKFEEATSVAAVTAAATATTFALTTTAAPTTATTTAAATAATTTAATTQTLAVPETTPSSDTGLVVGLAVGVSALVALGVVVFLVALRYRRRRGRAAIVNPTPRDDYGSVSLVKASASVYDVGRINAPSPARYDVGRLTS